MVVEVYTDAEEAELYINGELKERKVVGEKKKYIAEFDTIYMPGVVETVVYKDGTEVGRDRIITAKDEVQITAVAECKRNSGRRQ